LSSTIRKTLANMHSHLGIGYGPKTIQKII
jgi:hypothetical protein